MDWLYCLIYKCFTKIRCNNCSCIQGAVARDATIMKSQDVTKMSENEISDQELMDLPFKIGMLSFLDHPSEDIYTLEDGKAL